MKTQPPEAPKQGRPGHGQKAPPVPDMCKLLPLAAALAAGCPGVQVRPEPFDCPAGTEEVMREELGWRPGGDRFSILMDDRQGLESQPWFSAGSDVVGVVPKEAPTGRQSEVAPPGTRFLGGKVYLMPENKRTGRVALVVVKYDRVKVPGKDELPVCVVAETTALEMKGTAAKAQNSAAAFVVRYWP